MNSLVNKLARLPSAVFILFSFIIAICLYFNSLNGLPIFDDIHFLFQDDVITGEYSYHQIWNDFVWPLSISLHRYVFSIWKNEYIYYHLLNLGLHLFNSYLLLNLAQRLKLPFPKLLFLLFLVHPANVIAVSWMVQLKTLLCFTFAALSFICLINAFDNKRWYLPSWISFYLSIISKSASMPLGFIFLLFIFKKAGPRSVIWAIPFLLMSSHSAYKILQSSATSTATTQFESSTYVDTKIEHTTMPWIHNKNTVEEHNSIGELKKRASLILKTSHYYFWQALLPIDSYPIKGQAPKELSLIHGFHILFILFLFIINFGKSAGLCLYSGHLLLLPFLGFVIAPYMNLTWVSEQHLYIALPFFLCFWLLILSQFKLRFAHFIPYIFIGLYSVQTYRAASYYKNEIEFYSKSLLADPDNIPIVQNLAVSYLNINDPVNALATTSRIVEKAKINEEVRESKYFPYLLQVHENILKEMRPIEPYAP
jgi:hypothetical protein